MAKSFIDQENQEITKKLTGELIHVKFKEKAFRFKAAEFPFVVLLLRLN